MGANREELTFHLGCAKYCSSVAQIGFVHGYTLTTSTPTTIEQGVCHTYNLQKIPQKEKQNPSSYYNSITL